MNRPGKVNGSIIPIPNDVTAIRATIRIRIFCSVSTLNTSRNRRACTGFSIAPIKTIIIYIIISSHTI